MKRTCPCQVHVTFLVNAYHVSYVIRVLPNLAVQFDFRLSEPLLNFRLSEPLFNFRLSGPFLNFRRSKFSA